jgi:D-alanyl-D-alanine carboxypeptidase
MNGVNQILKQIHHELGITDRHLSECKLEWCEEPPLNHLEVTDIVFDGRPFILEKGAACAWREMCQSARNDGVTLMPYSGFRSYLHQRQLIRGKLDKGRSLEIILTETAIPGFSEHHSGRAVDICAENQFSLTEAFEKTSAFEWLFKNASQFGFRLSYPRDNDKGIIYEPWHWYFIGK